MIRIEEALARAKQQGRKVYKKDIAARLWPDASESARQVAMTRLCSGKTERFTLDWIRIISEMTGCTADFLMGMTND